MGGKEAHRERVALDLRRSGLAETIPATAGAARSIRSVTSRRTSALFVSVDRVVMVFGLSANPPTGRGGHEGIVTWAGREKRVDEVWVLPVFRHAFFEKREMPAFEHRMAMARLAFESLPGLDGRVFVKDTERQVVEDAIAQGTQGRVGTIDVMRRLIADHPGFEFVLLLGSDTYRDVLLGRWKESEALRSLVSIAVVPRHGVELPGIAYTGTPELSDVSSSRARRARDVSELRRDLHPAVVEYILAHGLYGFASVR